MKYSILLLLILISMYSFSQKDSTFSKNAFFLEIGGTAGHYSIKYDRTLYKTKNIGATWGIGFSPSLIPYNEDNRKFELSPRVPTQLNIIVGKGNSYLDLGFGYTLYHSVGSAYLLNHALFPMIGYRYHKSDGGLFFKSAFTPLIYDNGPGFMPWIAIGIGISFD